MRPMTTPADILAQQQKLLGVNPWSLWQIPAEILINNNQTGGVMFTQQNTKGFNQETLDKMNAELETIMNNYDLDNDDYEQIEKHHSEIIFNKYC